MAVELTDIGVVVLMFKQTVVTETLYVQVRALLITQSNPISSNNFCEPLFRYLLPGADARNKYSTSSPPNDTLHQLSFESAAFHTRQNNKD